MIFLKIQRRTCLIKVSQNTNISYQIKFRVEFSRKSFKAYNISCLKAFLTFKNEVILRGVRYTSDLTTFLVCWSFRNFQFYSLSMGYCYCHCIRNIERFYLFGYSQNLFYHKCYLFFGCFCFSC